MGGGVKIQNGMTVAQNRRARHNYTLHETYEAGLELLGTEVKSLREGRCNIQEAYAQPIDGEIWLLNANIPEYAPATHFNHRPTRPRKLLLHKNEVRKLVGAVTKQGMTIIPLSVYFTTRGLAKVNVALAKGKRKPDKRETEKQRDWAREKARLLREKG